MLVILLPYGCLGFLAGWLSHSCSTALWLSLPALPALLLFGEDTTLAVLYFALIASCASLGGSLGARTSAGRRWS